MGRRSRGNHLQERAELGCCADKQTWEQEERVVVVACGQNEQRLHDAARHGAHHEHVVDRELLASIVKNCIQCVKTRGSR